MQSDSTTVQKTDSNQTKLSPAGLKNHHNISDDKSLNSQDTSGNLAQSLLGKRLCNERGGGSSPIVASGNDSPFSDPQQNISATS